MTNGDWIRNMTDEELAKNVINPCKFYKCETCPARDQRGRCVVECGERCYDITMEWLESEHVK